MAKASIIIPTYNMAYFIRKTILSILSQDESNFELIIIDDASTDNTKEIVCEFNDKRIRYIKNKKNIGKSLSRNKAIKIARSDYLFFTDADCMVNKNWIKSGLELFKRTSCIGIEGKIFYVSETYKPSYSDRVIQNLYGGEYMTANAAYKKSEIIKINLFNKKYKRNQDREFALRVKKIGKILFNPSMIVYHGVSKWSASEYIKSSTWVYFRTVLLFKKFDDRYNMHFRVYAPKNLLSIIFPPIILIKLINKKYESKSDYLHFLLLYPYLVLERFTLWKTCFTEKVFII